MPEAVTDSSEYSCSGANVTEPQITLACEENIPEIITLQQSGLDNGAINLMTPMEDLMRLLKKDSIVVAKAGRKVIGYVLSIDLEDNAQFQHPKNCSYLGDLEYQDKPLLEYDIQLGQSCVDGSFRGRGIAMSMYELVLRQSQKRCDLRVARVNTTNASSIKFHIRKLNMQTVGNCITENGKEALIFVLDLRGEVQLLLK